MHVPGNTGAKRSKFKQDLLLEVVEATDRQACGDAWTLGFVVLGDLNLQLREVTEALQGWHGESSQECLDVVGAGVPCGSHVGVDFFLGGDLALRMLKRLWPCGARPVCHRFAIDLPPHGQR